MARHSIQGASAPAEAAPSRMVLRPRTGLPDMDRARFTAEPRFEVLIPQETRFGALIQDNLHLPQGRYEVEVPPIGHHVLIFGLKLRQAQWDTRLAGRRVAWSPRPDGLMVFPAGVDAHFVATQGAERLLHLHLGPAWLSGIAAEAGLAEPSLQLLTEAQDPHMTALFRRIAATLQDGAAGAALLREHAAILVGVELLRLLHARTAPTRHRIAPARLRAVLAYIEEHLAEEITLADLAAVARLSRFHFARAFRAEAGVAPHAHVTLRRVERAKRLMLEGGTALSEIALACGFAHQAHFTTAFRRVTGTTPGRWREERLS
ncbi:AraC family transcriptional regulator [Falsiroseomonas selenitidurans]|uniref:Helix-turn-helix transcriptional regulator n=1 Tax=Falsiroseomonas selenitidurans TaxID=2716335 RepID=A0ABX1E9K9_9PROT|nr:AraC family transcriptional regulator [Falsiroseomonas selenitidurans]NKC33872.1 helix-turn-helix transcriptional regulator [Falsiroseomonas selenitidurans]